MSGEDVTGNPLDRIRKFCDEYAQMGGLDPDRVTTLHLGHREREAAITISDLRALLAEREARQKEVEMLRGLLTEWVEYQEADFAAHPLRAASVPAMRADQAMRARIRRSRRALGGESV